jgi:hypothetical protein
VTRVLFRLQSLRGSLAVGEQTKLKAIKKSLAEDPTFTAKQLQKKVPYLGGVSIRVIEHICLKKLKLLSRKMAKNPILIDRMRLQRLEFARHYQDWGVEVRKDILYFPIRACLSFTLALGWTDYCRLAVGSDHYVSKFTKKMVKHQQKVMVWGFFS